jgi:peptidylprolyl isomerase
MRTPLLSGLIAVLCLCGCSKSSTTVDQTTPAATPTAPAAPAAPAGLTVAPAATPPANNGDMITTASGLKYMVMKKGAGTVSPKPTDTVKVHYQGTLLNGTVFDSSIQRGEPAVFPLDRVIPGWTEGLQLMKVGDKFKFEIPANLAYGSRSLSGIPANSTLVFEVELLEIQ